MAVTDEIAVKLGINTTQFKAALKDANASVTQFKQAGTFGTNEGFGATVRGMHHELRTLHQFLVAGGLATLFRELWVKGEEYAKNYTGEINNNVEAMKRLQEAYKDTNIAGEVMTFLAGTMEKFGLLVGAAVYGVDAAGDALMKMDAAAQKAFDEARVKKFNDAMAALEKQRRDYAYAQLSDSQKMAFLAKEQFDLMEKQNGLAKDNVEYVKLQQQIEAKGYEIEKLENKEAQENNKKLYDLVFGRVEGLEPKSQEHAEKKLKVEKQITAEMQAQQAALEAQNELTAKQNLVSEDTLIVNGKAYGASRTPRQFETASNAELQDFIDKTKREISDVLASEGHGATALADAASGYIIQGSVVARLQTDIIRAQYQLDQRRSIASTVSQFGEQAARANFSGDPLTFDNLLAVATRQQTEQTKTNQQLEDLNSRLAGAGFPRH